ncbi:estradiol 17-beta-dehydrogenase 8-like isoform X2 [Limulus polyphemus]|nr:estradiol 17-beta-dehydrogenase 8-like isoform X2 [Limulus polyphemus]XP_022238931.1 estradiol 17-beta-dehydrogenase 8-like isoform X2 [Limulus polyphemus]
MASAKLLSGHLALVTGGGSEIGKAVCQALACEGAKIVIADKNENAAKLTLQSLPQGEENVYIMEVVDVSQSHSVTNLFTSINQRLSQVPDIVVNSAGIAHDGLMNEMTEQMFDDVLNVNLKGTFLITQAACRLMISEKIKNGSIVNISSIIGKVGNIGQCNYAASKAGVVGLTKSVAKEMARHGIRCNAIMPGFIDTPVGVTIPEKVMSHFKKLTPLARCGKPEDVAEACLFLASSKSKYITGEVIEVTGGLFM